MNDGRGGTPEHVGSLVEGLLKARGLAEAVERASAIPEWSELVGPEIARISAPVGFDREVLFVEVRSSAWLMELEMMERRLLARINAGRRRGKFEKIVFRLAEGERWSGRVVGEVEVNREVTPNGKASGDREEEGRGEEVGGEKAASGEEEIDGEK